MQPRGPAWNFDGMLDALVTIPGSLAGIALDHLVPVDRESRVILQLAGDDLPCPAVARALALACRARAFVPTRALTWPELLALHRAIVGQIAAPLILLAHGSAAEMALRLAHETRGADQPRTLVLVAPRRLAVDALSDDLPPTLVQLGAHQLGPEGPSWNDHCESLELEAYTGLDHGAVSPNSSEALERLALFIDTHLEGARMRSVA